MNRSLQQFDGISDQRVLRRLAVKKGYAVAAMAMPCRPHLDIEPIPAVCEACCDKIRESAKRWQAWVRIEIGFWDRYEDPQLLRESARTVGYKDSQSLPEDLREMRKKLRRFRMDWLR